MLVLALAARAGGDAASESWPPFLGSRADFPPEIAAAVQRVWSEPTLRRTVQGRTAHVPFAIYVVFVDTPEVTAAAARFRKLARYDVRALGDDWYRAEDGGDARGVYRVLVREGTRRVILSWGAHSGSILGTITGSALSVLDFEPRDGIVDQRLTAYVKIDNGIAATLARIFITIFGHIADRKLVEGFAVSAQIAEWAVAQPAEFCEWLARQPVAPARRERLLGVLPACLDKNP